MDELEGLAERLKGRSILHVNSASEGGGVAEILHHMLPLSKSLGLSMRWDVIKGSEEFFGVTKKFHNLLHGEGQEVTAADFKVFEETNEENLASMNFEEDFIFIHDPQPVALVKARDKYKNRWLWRCHIDISRADPTVWEFLRPHVEKYDVAVISTPQFSQQIMVPQVVISPCIDPLSDKNRDLSDAEVKKIMERLKIPTDKPLVTQVSRFDRIKDPKGVVQAFQAVAKSIDARLLLVGGFADDDPEGAQVYAEIKEVIKDDDRIIALTLPPTSHVEINAIQRASTLIIQKSLREGFGLTVSEALWKGKPVIASAVGGIPLQIIHGHSGVLVRSIEGVSYWIKKLLAHPEMAKTFGENGREHVKNNFLLTRHLRDHLLLYLFAENSDKNFIRI